MQDKDIHDNDKISQIYTEGFLDKLADYRKERGLPPLDPQRKSADDLKRMSLARPQYNWKAGATMMKPRPLQPWEQWFDARDTDKWNETDVATLAPHIGHRLGLNRGGKEDSGYSHVTLVCETCKAILLVCQENEPKEKATPQPPVADKSNF